MVPHFAVRLIWVLNLCCYAEGGVVSLCDLLVVSIFVDLTSKNG